MIPYFWDNNKPAKDAALASYAAWDQGKFWEMRDLLFESAPNLDRKTINELARRLHLDMARFDAAMGEQDHLNSLKANIEKVHAADIWSTPTAIVNGMVIEGAEPFTRYIAAVDRALGKETPATALPVESTKERGGASCTIMGQKPWSVGVIDTGEIETGESGVPLFVRIPELRPTNALKVGDEAPDFTLPSALGGTVTLSHYRGNRNVLLVFLPAAFTPV